MKIYWYLENPKRFYELSSRAFEEIMAEIYPRLGYQVEVTKQTVDGGKDIILKESKVTGDFIYYVECKKYHKNNKVGIGIVRNLHSTITTDNVNGGFIATTSYFTRNAIDYINNYKQNYRIKMHDFNKISELLRRVVN